MLLEFSKFGGANIALHPLLLPDGVGVDSRNCSSERGDLRPLKAPANVASVLANAQTIYRMGRAAPSDTNYWLAWTGEVDIARGFVAEDTSERTFWSGDGAPKWTDNSIGLGAPPFPASGGVRILGVPKPNAAPGLSQTVAGSGTDESRAYIVVWVNDRGEPSMPSDAATITCKPGATIDVTRNATLPTGAYGLQKWRVYRTVAGNDADYFFVGEALAAAASLTDTGAVNTADVLQSEDWAMPPAGLKGLKALWNGMLVGFIGKAVCFCEPLYPFAWPVRYQIPLDAEIVGLARMGLMLVVLTVDQPYILSGSNPEAMSPQVVDFKQSCVARRGIVELGDGVAWPSPDGMCYIGIDGSRAVLTAGIATRADWQGLSPSTLVAGENEGKIIASFVRGGMRESFVLDPRAPGEGLRFCDAGFVACWRDPIGDAFYVLAPLSTGQVQRWDSGATLAARHKSKVVRVSRPVNFAYAQVLADAYPVRLWMWADGQPILHNYPVTNGDGFRLPAGFLADQWQVQLQTTAPVQQLLLAHSAAELRGA